MTRSRVAVFFLLAALAALTEFLLLPLLGLQTLSLRDVWMHPAGSAGQIYWQLRLPRQSVAFLAGAGLALGGLAFQALFRNPLATPFTLGTASGASLGATFYLWAGWSFQVLGISGTAFFAFGGALLALGSIYLLSRARRGFPTETMLLAGVALSFLFSSLILLLQYLSNQVHSLRILRWLMGGLDVVGFQSFWEALPWVGLGTVILIWRRWDLNLLAAGEDLAAGRGMAVERSKILIMSAVGLMVSAIVAVTGPIGFVGIMIPHVCRLILGPDHRYLTGAVLLLGGVFLPVCDAFARMVLAPAEMPVGIITALLGGPFFLWLLIRQRKQ
ncbi:MAG: iron ABC transporter permease [Candidatus Firestonebacteria bacterium]|nr:iron ABC transporter permease [Candidatus Firestonebacteria bacterium]